ncbi:MULTISPECIES: MOSC domain-containing protein [Pseudomonas syringae group]|uniref:MOSC domain-containing protein n=1 Tax=Pseudomonas syringae group TaxID=136849 RepID=UPI0005B705BB|nr:MOSC domain-containing protein [Pseudomonas viridiflava]MBD8807603.1 MOSC domain-containing protein [Pseudomonas syringae]KIQ35105.1 molybdenum cofactor sulfurase [Pseudomonas viridiflava]MEE4099817.1 MOSC domain-containing protein [Pseudomonas viridiflava]MEE4125703.1 MOSC domain-containing protein [Pseudomonas viridiflava]MEE4226382.1 MOSC domain-containing protein [Pseudomonas viridiflava]
MLRLRALYRFPLKSCKAEILQRASFDGLGLAGDRRWMLVDEGTGRFLTQRAVSHMSQLSVLWNAGGGVTLDAPGFAPLDVAVPIDEQENLRGVTVWRDSLQVPDAGQEAADWVSRFIGKPTRMVYMPVERARWLPGGYGSVDNRVNFADGFPLLLIGQGSLDDLSARLGREVEMLRFRPNLVIEGAEAFAEDNWKRIRIGDMQFELLKPCARCILTTIDPATGERSPDREPFATLKTYREVEGDVMFGQNMVNVGPGELEVDMEVEVLE